MANSQNLSLAGAGAWLVALAAQVSGFVEPYLAGLLFFIGAALFVPAIRDWSRKHGWLPISSIDDRIPYVQVRTLANARGWKLDDNPAGCHNSAQCHNRAYDLEIAMRQAASDGTLKVWGRKCETAVGSNPLLSIPKEHFTDFEFYHGYLHSDNVKNISTHTGKLGKDINYFGGAIYCDLHVSKRDIERLLRRLTPSDGIVKSSMY